MNIPERNETNQIKIMCKQQVCGIDSRYPLFMILVKTVFEEKCFSLK